MRKSLRWFVLEAVYQKTRQWQSMFPYILILALLVYFLVVLQKYICNSHPDSAPHGSYVKSLSLFTYFSHAKLVKTSVKMLYSSNTEDIAKSWDTYTLHRKKVTFNLSICRGAPGSLTLTDGLDDSVKMTHWLYPRVTKKNQWRKWGKLFFGAECTIECSLDNHSLRKADSHPQKCMSFKQMPPWHTQNIMNTDSGITVSSKFQEMLLVTKWYQGLRNEWMLCKDVDSYSTCLLCDFPIGTLLWKVSKILRLVYCKNLIHVIAF